MVKLTVSKHKRASGLLSRALASLENVGRMLGDVRRNAEASERCDRAVTLVKMLRQEMEDAALQDHPQSNVRYTLPPATPSSSVMNDAVAGAGDGVGEVD
jgi:hypothetical protein